MRILIVEAAGPRTATFGAELRLHGHDVDATDSGAVALNLVNTTRYDIVILDGDTPALDVTGVCRQLRANGHHLPIMLLTNDAAPHTGIAGLDAGADTYLSKPVEFAELLARIRALRRREVRTWSTVLHVADLTLDPKTREVQRDGQRIVLTRTEYAILEYLLRHPNQVLSHAQIAAAAWEDDMVVTSDVLKVHIAALRRKLRDEQEPRLLHTVRGRGYSLRLPANSPAGEPPGQATDAG